MIINRYAVCSERGGKPVTRLVCESKPEAEAALEQIKKDDASRPERSYWVAELGPEAEAWRWFAVDKAK